MAWHTPDKLQTTEAEFRAAGSGSLGQDFGSYVHANRVSLEGSRARSHNLIDGARIRARIYRRFLRGHEIRRIADLGCGLGFMTAAMADEFACEAHGFEVSHDAFEYASRAHARPTIAFYAGAIDPEQGTSLGDGDYDLILCQEFYPFTRSSDAASHVRWLEFLLPHLSQNGVILIEMSGRYESGTDHETMVPNLSRLRRDLPTLKIDLGSAPNVHVARFLPYPLAKPLCLIGARLTGQRVLCDLIVTVSKRA